MKIKELINKLKQISTTLFTQYIITLPLIILTTLFFAIFLDTKLFSPKLLGNIFLFLSLLITGTIFTETYFKNKNIKKIVSYTIFLIASIVFVILNNINLPFSKHLLYRILACYYIVINLSTLYKIYIDSKKSIEEYTIKAFSNLVITSFLYSTLSSGIMMVTLLFSFLIIGDEEFSLIWRSQIMIIGLFYIPSLLICLTNTKEEPIKFIKVVVKTILRTILIIAFIIIYIYMLKILILRRIPSNQIFRILSILFMIGLPIWTMNGYFKEETIFQKINNLLPILFIPFIFLQIYSLSVRIINNGFTPLRYLCVIYILIEIIYILIYIFKRKNISIMFNIVSALIIISLLIPGINMFTVSNKSQYSIIKKYLEKDNLTSKEKDKLYSAYEYLNSSNGGKKYISKDERNIIKNKYNKKYIYNYSEDIYGELKNKEINIEGYKTISKFNIYKDLEENTNNIFKNIKINNNNYDLTNLVHSYIENNKLQDFNTYFNNNNEVIVNENEKLVITVFNILYKDQENIINYYNIEGYILKR